MAVRQSAQTELPGVLGRTISTEFAVTGFQLVGGVFGGIAALIASRRLESAPSSIPLARLTVPVAIAGISNVIGALLLPTGD